jgi:VWFA-related protein
LTDDRQALKERIDKIRKPDGGTKFYDAVEDTLHLLLNSRNNERNVIVIMSDGVDNSLPHVPGEGSETTFDQLIRDVEESNATIFPIYLDTEADAIKDFSKQISIAYAIARKQLAELAEDTGGTLFYAKTASDLAGRYQQVIDQVSMIYSLGYYPNSNERGSGYRKIRVQVDRDDAQVRSRRGYFAKSNN